MRCKEAGNYLGMSGWKLRELVQQEQLPYIQYKEHGPWWFDLSDLDKLIEEKKRGNRS